MVKRIYKKGSEIVDLISIFLASLFSIKKLKG